MSRARHHTHKKEHHKHHADGGTATETGGNPHVFALAKEKHSIGHIGGEKGKPRMDRRRGGGVHHKHHAGGGAAENPYSEGPQKNEDGMKHGGAMHHHHHGLHGAHKKEHKSGGRC